MSKTLSGYVSHVLPVLNIVTNRLRTSPVVFLQFVYILIFTLQLAQRDIKYRRNFHIMKAYLNYNEKKKKK